MSRIGKEPVKLADGVTATVSGQTVTVKGKLGELSYTMHEGITAKVEDGSVVVSCADDKALGAFHGLARALINNMAVGVSQGFQKQLSIEGTGFKAVLKGQELALSLGFASPKVFAIPAGLTVTVENDGLQVTIKGCDKQMVGEAAARIRSYYPAEPYKGKGIKYVGEHIRRNYVQSQSPAPEEAPPPPPARHRHRGASAHVDLRHQQEHVRAVHRRRRRAHARPGELAQGREGQPRRRQGARLPRGGGGEGRRHLVGGRRPRRTQVHRPCRGDRRGRRRRRRVDLGQEGGEVSHGIQS